MDVSPKVIIGLNVVATVVLVIGVALYLKGI